MRGYTKFQHKCPLDFLLTSSETIFPFKLLVSLIV